MKVPALVALAARAAGPYMTLEILEKIPEEYHKLLRYYLPRSVQIKLFKEYVHFFDNGELATWEQFNDEGQRHGTLQRYGEWGVPLLDEHYMNGKKHGGCCEFNQDGLPLFMFNYKRGRMKGWQCTCQWTGGKADVRKWFVKSGKRLRDPSKRTTNQLLEEAEKMRRYVYRQLRERREQKRQKCS